MKVCSFQNEKVKVCYASFGRTDGDDDFECDLNRATTKGQKGQKQVGFESRTSEADDWQRK